MFFMFGCMQGAVLAITAASHIICKFYSTVVYDSRVLDQAWLPGCLATIVYGLSSTNCLCSLALTINEPNYKLQTTNH